jgi:hypothetical protein
MKSILPGYHTSQQIYESANSLVYRATREHDMRPVILTVLKPHYSNLAELSYYNHEYEILRRLNLSGVIEVFGLEPYPIPWFSFWRIADTSQFDNGWREELVMEGRPSRLHDS